MSMTLFDDTIQSYLKGDRTKADAAALLFSLAPTPGADAFMVGNAPAEDQAKLRDLFLHVAWLHERQRDPDGAPSEPPTWATILEELPPETRAHLRRFGVDSE